MMKTTYMCFDAQRLRRPAFGPRISVMYHVNSFAFALPPLSQLQLSRIWSPGAQALRHFSQSQTNGASAKRWNSNTGWDGPTLSLDAGTSSGPVRSRTICNHRSPNTVPEDGQLPSSIIHKLFMTAWDMWDHRNKVLHAPDGPRAIIEQAHLSAQITSEYNRGLEGLRPSDHYLLQDPLQSILSGTCSSQRKWLHSVHLARQLGPVDAAATASAQLRRQQNLMRQWLQLPGLAPHVT